jgi:glyoxylase-like metal-dependent hydrolase (beta-lactamase superfamily II)
VSELEVVALPNGQFAENCYLVADRRAREAVIIDPGEEPAMFLAELDTRAWTLRAIWLTHAHFDHIAGVRTLMDATQPQPMVGLHPADLPLWRQGGGARIFGMQVEAGPEPRLHFEHEQTLSLGKEVLEVRHTPGHTPGHVIFYSRSAQAALCGDLIFFHGVGRTDLPGGDMEALLQSIHTQILTLPPDTRLLSGHGQETTVKDEQAENPFL